MTHEGDIAFESALSASCDRARNGESLQSILASQPEEYRDQLGLLVPLAGRVRTLAADPTPAFRGRVARQVAPACRMPSDSRRWALSGFGIWLRARPLVLAVAIVLVIGLALGAADAVAASESTLPDSPIYQVKATREWVEISLTRDPSARAKVHLRQIAQREMELERALATNRSPAVVQAIAGRLSAATERMVTDALIVRRQGNPSPGQQASDAIRALEQRLDRLSVRARPRVRPILTVLQQDLAIQRARLGSS